MTFMTGYEGVQVIWRSMIHHNIVQKSFFYWCIKTGGIEPQGGVVTRSGLGPLSGCQKPGRAFMKYRMFGKFK